LFGYVGNHGALLLLLVTPLLWDVPTILTVLELNSLMPATGGYYQWVKRALGIRWAFFEGWWTWLYTFCDLAIYPVIFVTYASFFIPGIVHYKVLVCLGIIWSSALLNILGILPVGRVSSVLSIIVLVPFCFLFIMAFGHHGAPIPMPSISGSDFPNLGMGLYVVMWNFIGWDNATTYAGEVQRPIRAYFISVCMAFLVTIGIYLLAALAVTRSGINADAISIDNGGFPVLGVLIGGRWLGILVASGGMASAIGLYSAVLLSVSRVPQVMADDQLLPTFLCSLHPRFKTPYVSILASSIIVSILILFTFSDLVIMDIILYGAGLSLEFIALVTLRRTEPSARRPFRIPLGRGGLVLLYVLPLTIYTAALTGAFLAKKDAPFWSSEKSGPILLAFGMLFSAAIAWRLIRWRRPHLAGSKS
ncbi:MAG TPA: APC family permease, partial [Verrucomicrobiae bacterium]|nr:APC family permease [Verrucomicrobiae bacterium]